MEIKERMIRNNNEDMIYIGQIIESATSGEFGAIFRSIIEALKDIELQKSIRQEGNSNKVLGRLEAYNLIQNELDNAIAIKDNLLTEIKEEQIVGDAPQGEKLQRASTL